MSSDFQPEVGHEFSIDMGNWGTMKCTVLEVVPQELIRYTWKNPPLDTVVTWKLIPEGQGTRVFVEHSGFDLDDPIQLRRTKEWVAAGRAASSPSWPSTYRTEIPSQNQFRTYLGRRLRLSGRSDR